MTVLTFLMTWLALQLPLGMFLGRAIAILGGLVR